MLISKVVYKGNLRTIATHLQSGQEIITDAPLDNQGKGEAFSPTDLLVSSLASCMLTIMGIKAHDMDLSLENCYAEVTKIMTANPRRVAEIKILFEFDSGHSFSDKERKILKKAAETCPVAYSLHPDIKIELLFKW
jgi:putative redox protein